MKNRPEPLNKQANSNELPLAKNSSCMYKQYKQQVSKSSDEGHGRNKAMTMVGRATGERGRKVKRS